MEGVLAGVRVEQQVRECWKGAVERARRRRRFGEF